MISVTLAPEHRGSTASRRPVPSSSAGTSLLARRLIAGSGRADRSVAALAAAACLVGALVVTIVLGALQATQQRVTAEAWLAPQRVTMEDAGALLRAADRYIDGQRLTVVRYAPIPGRTAPVPPGLDEAPRPGEVFVSAAAAKVGAPELEGKTITGELGEEALRSPDDRTIVIGEAPDSPVMTEPGFVAQSGIGANQPPTPIAAFGGEPHRLNSASETTNYVHLTAIAVLLIVPVLSLMGPQHGSATGAATDGWRCSGSAGCLVVKPSR